MPLKASTALKDMADALVAEAVKMSLHSADPGSTGANETSAGRQTITLVDDGSGNLSVSNVSFTGGAANGACQYVGLWNSAGTVFYGGFALTGDTTFNSSGQYTVTSLAIAASSTG